MKSEEGNSVLRKIRSDPNYKGGQIEPLAKILYMNHLADIMKEPRYQICKEVFMMIPIVIYTQKDYHLLNEINIKLQTFETAGLINYWSFERNFNRVHDIKQIRKALTLDHLKGAFQILWFGSLIGVIVFILELLSSVLTKKRLIKSTE